ncbi:hypothetical protein I79_014178 [Cricetulus griseus]|uniref:Uncharacterized protein n=1 Tax=Cricetulus griseus TaxID=10029 RepID=G3HTF3_CRIGR|nr:hypothetical protein I79_014178 [Cricetulus griseus]
MTLKFPPFGILKSVSCRVFNCRISRGSFCFTPSLPNLGENVMIQRKHIHIGKHLTV